MKKLKILISAFAFNPIKPSYIENNAGYTGWKLVEQLAQFCDICVVTGNQNRANILEALVDGTLPEMKIHFVNLPSHDRLLDRSLYGQYLCHYIWQKRALEEVRKLHAEYRFDAAHHLTLGPVWLPGLIGASFPIPFIWGPLRGEERIPKKLRQFYSKRFTTGKTGIRIIQWLVRHHHARKKCVRTASAILLSDSGSLAGFPNLDKKKVHFFPSYGIDSVNGFSGTKAARARKRFSVISAGRLDQDSGFTQAIRAFYRFARNHPQAEYTIFGEGPDKCELEHLISSMDCQSRIRIHPRIDISSMRERLVSSDLFLTAAWSGAESAWIIEAMAAGLPVVCLDLSGLGIHIQDKWGIKVKPGPEDRVIRDLAKALERLYSGKKLRLLMGKAAMKNAKENYIWRQQGKILKRIYGEALLQEEDIRISKKGEERFFY